MNGPSELIKSQIALLAGDDLEHEEEAQEVRRSIEACPQCRQHWVRLRGCVDVLDRVSRSNPAGPSASLWPEIESRLQRTVSVRQGKFNGWVPALSMAAACIALLLAGQMDGLPPQEMSSADHVVLFGGAVSPFVLGQPTPLPEAPADPSLFRIAPDSYSVVYPQRDAQFFPLPRNNLSGRVLFGR